MRHYIPYFRSDGDNPQVESVMHWLKINELLEVLQTLPPENEFPLLLAFLIEFAGGLELAKCRMAETLVEQAAVSYQAHADAVKKISTRIYELYKMRGTVCEE